MSGKKRPSKMPAEQSHAEKAPDRKTVTRALAIALVAAKQADDDIAKLARQSTKH